VVTIVLPVYNGASTLKIAIESILKQRFRDWELIIIDDASSDDSLKVIREFDDSRIVVFAGEHNLGLSARLNMAIDMAKGDYFARMDQDDISFPERISRQLEYLQANPEVDLLATATLVFKDDGEYLGCLPVARDHESICARPWNGFHLPHPTWMGKIEWFRKHAYVSSADGAEDQHLLLRSYLNSRFACLDEALLAYREGSRSLKKISRARRIFTRAYIGEFVAQNRYDMAILVAINFVLKRAADVLNLVFGVKGMRNQLRPLSADEILKWNVISGEMRDQSL
jgi:glycosyltransferase involved in cell wall biosynthesis